VLTCRVPALCRCRPCHHVLACPCDQPPEQRFPPIDALVAANSSAPNETDLPTIPSVALLPRFAYSYAAWRDLAAAGAAGNASAAAAAAAAGSRRAGCGNTIAEECWTCPESGQLDFVDPIRSLYRCTALHTLGSAWLVQLALSRQASDHPSLWLAPLHANILLNDGFDLMYHASLLFMGSLAACIFVLSNLLLCFNMHLSNNTLL
jgi:hypothetical protein